MFKKINGLIVVTFLCVCFSYSAGSVSSEHPWLFFSKQDIGQLQSKVKTDTWISDAYRVLKEHADEYMTVSTDPYAYAGKHNGKGTVGRALEKKIGVLAFTGYLTGDERYFRKAVEIILSAAAQSDPENHDVWLTHLQVADGARAYAVAYDWLYPYMDDQQRKTIRDEVYKFGRLLYECGTCWGQPDPGVSSCNHNAVHFGALGLCALVLGDQPEWQARATQRIRDYFKYVMDPTGYFTEGHSYANYGLLGALPYSHALQRAGGPDLVNEQPLMERMTDQFCWKKLPASNDILALNDNADDLGTAGMLIYPISRYKQGEALWCWLKAVGEEGDKTYGIGRNGYEGDGLSVPYEIIWSDPNLKPVSPAKTGWALSHKFQSGRVFMRDSWDNPLGALVSFTSGVDFHRGHNHQDENAFTFHAKGESFAIDPGYMPNNTRSHNTMLVNGIGQIETSSGRIIDYQDLGAAVYVKGQAPEAYEWSTLLGHFQRQILFGRAEHPYLLIVDDLQCETDMDAKYTWLLHTDKKNKISISENEKKAVITGRNGKGLCEVICLNKEVPLTETSLAGETFNRRGTDYKYAGFFKELKADITTVHCKIVTLLIARSAEESPAKIVYFGQGLDWTVHIAFADYTDTLIASKNNIGFVRKMNDSKQ